MEHEIIIEVALDGKITATVRGVNGPVCGDLSKWLDELGQVERDDPTAEFYESEQSTLYLEH